MTAVYDKNNLFLARIKERRDLCKEGSEKNTYHVVLDLEGSGITYRVGDSIAVQPTNDPAIVDRMLDLLKASPDTIVHDKHTKEPMALKDFFSRKANLASVPKKLILELANRQTDSPKQERLQFLLQETQKELLKEYQAAHEVWDTLAENEEVLLGAEELCHMLQPLLPRFYSIASAMRTVGNEVHLLIADVTYTTNSYQRYGVCTDYLCRRAPLQEPCVPVYIQTAHDFTVPDFDDLPIVMIGPGTGVAPFRAFMQEREARKANGSNWLFFGEWHRDQQFFYEEEWNDWVLEGKLRLETAFSRDQEHKVYVQHKMLEHAKHLFDLLEKGALLYVCGDAHRMAKDVDAALNLIVRSQGNLDEAGAKQYMKKLKAEKRYLRDVY